MTDRIKEAITEWWGERCKDHEPGCAICDAWAEFDALNITPEGVARALARKGYELPAKVLASAMQRGGA